MNILLLTVDPQVDFISGSLPVPGAVTAMNNLAAYISDNNGKYLHKIVTADRHPYNHSSFTDNGGKWPRHCVHDTVGAAVWQPVFDALYTTGGEVSILYKGQIADIEEYSIFKNQEAAAAIDRLIHDLRIEQIDICGLAGDVCVNNTLQDGIARYGSGMFNVLTDFSPSIDGGKALGKTIKENQLKCDR